MEDATLAKSRAMNLAALIAWLQGGYFLALGLWPLVSIRTFKAVTGEKTDNAISGLDVDHWLVNTVGILVAVIGLVLVVAAWRRSMHGEIALLGAGSALSLAAIDAIYVARSVISRIYLADFLLEILFAATWVIWAYFRLATRRSA